MFIHGERVLSQDDREYRRFVKALGDKIDSYGKPRWPLPNMREVPVSHYFHHVSIWGPLASTAGASFRENNNSHYTIIFFSDRHDLLGGGYVIDYWHDGKEYRCRCHEWRSCIHSFESKNLGRCWNRYTCTKCGDSYEVDSSD